jgi:protein-disulfide isomerase
MQNAINAPESTTPTRWSLLPGLANLMLTGLLIGLLPGMALGAGIGLALSSRATPPIATVQQAIPTPASLLGERAADVSPELPLKGAQSFKRLGDANAPVTLVVFEDPRCGFCKQMATGTELQLIEKYVKTGKLALVTRAFDVLGADSTRISLAAACAGKAGKYWEFRSQYFGGEIGSTSDLDTQINTWAIAADIGDMSTFKNCLNSDEVRLMVEGDNAVGRELEIRGTPTLFVNGKRLIGAVPLEFIETAIAEATK